MRKKIGEENLKTKLCESNLKKLTEFIKEYSETKKYAPSIREMGEAININSTSTICYYLKKLEKRGIIKRDYNKSRVVEVCEFPKYPRFGSSQNVVNIPLLGDIVAGYPLLSEENIDELFYVSQNIFNTMSDLFSLTVKGDSMIDAGIKNGDILVVKVQNTAENGDIVVARTEQGTTVKKFYKDNNVIRLVPQNVSYMPIIVKEVEILGKVIGVIRRL